MIRLNLCFGHFFSILSIQSDEDEQIRLRQLSVTLCHVLAAVLIAFELISPGLCI